MFKHNLVKVLDKPNVPSDYDSYLRWTWARDSQRPPIYTTEITEHGWDRDVVEPRSR